MNPKHIQIGKTGEQIAREYLIRSGYVMIATNWRYKNHYEIDILVYDNENTIVAVEVRSLSKISQISPLNSISKTKIKQIKDALNIYASINKLTNRSLRVDVISVVIDANEVEHFKSVDLLFEL